MLFAIICTYRPGGDVARLPFRADHLQYMIDALPVTLFGGPLLLEDGAASTGLVVVLDLPDRDAVADFIAGEPYARAGLFEIVVIRRWRHMTAEVLAHELKGERARRS